MTEGDFDSWLERSLERELGSMHRVAPARDWTRGRPQVRRRLTLASGAGGALLLKGATGLVAVAFAVGVTGTAMSGSSNPVAWGQAMEEATVGVLPMHLEDSTPTPAPTEQAPAPRPVSLVASGARQEGQGEKTADADGHGSRHGDAHHSDIDRGPKGTPGRDDRGSAGRPGTASPPATEADGSDSHD